MITQLTIEDAPLWREIRLLAIVDSPPAFLESYEDAVKRPETQYREQIENNTILAWREPDGTIAGTLGFHVMRGSNMRHRGYVWGMFVRAECRGRGIASALIDAVVAHARPLVTQLHLGAEATNEAAVGLYKKHGFTIYGTDPKTVCIDGVYYDDHLMVKML